MIWWLTLPQTGSLWIGLDHSIKGWLPCTEIIYNRRPYAIKTHHYQTNESQARKYLPRFCSRTPSCRWYTGAGCWPPGTCWPSSRCPCWWLAGAVLGFSLSSPPPCQRPSWRASCPRGLRPSWHPVGSSLRIPFQPFQVAFGGRIVWPWSSLCLSYNKKITIFRVGRIYLIRSDISHLSRMSKINLDFQWHFQGGNGCSLWCKKLLKEGFKSLTKSRTIIKLYLPLLTI